MLCSKSSTDVFLQVLLESSTTDKIMWVGILGTVFSAARCNLGSLGWEGGSVIDHALCPLGPQAWRQTGLDSNYGTVSLWCNSCNNMKISVASYHKGAFLPHVTAHLCICISSVSYLCEDLQSWPGLASLRWLRGDGLSLLGVVSHPLTG